MINGLEGIPGSGKSYEAVAYHVLPALQIGRKVITNLPLVVDMFAAIDPDYRKLIEIRTTSSKIKGEWDATAIDENGNGQAFRLFPSESDYLDPPHDATLFGGVWDYHSEWKHPKTGQGPLFVIDESHVPLPSTGTSKEVVQWFKLHRHFNADVLLMTQSFRDMNQPIARLMAMVIVCRKADILGKKDCYIRKVKGGYRGAVISTEQRPYKPQFFGLYKSHTQGNSVAEAAASDVSSFVGKFRRFTIGFWVFAVVVVIWAFWPAEKKQPKSKAATQAQSVSAHSVPGALPALLPVSAPALPASDSGVASALPGNPEPYASKGLHLTGRIAMGSMVVYTFSVSMAGRRIATLDSRDLIAVGYTWQPLTDCAGILRWGSDAKAVTCDAPDLGQGTVDRPVVLAVPEGSSTPTASSVPGIVSVSAPPAPVRQSGMITPAEITASLGR
ncbi:zonular occludens toxin domain-containing protein [Paracidovorax anthurii]|uniref:Zona occludens toxin n=1 Tax=Paracidovorax anthurii TaxID=78229 RepID=A0A328ZF71_9BURK|nr:zonular occludens toxin domain-containing protein [Paracidovorax anthurii]RAR83923.1 zona occludens toxin [Paracidovorax anthurii]